MDRAPAVFTVMLLVAYTTAYTTCLYVHPARRRMDIQTAKKAVNKKSASKSLKDGQPCEIAKQSPVATSAVPVRPAAGAAPVILGTDAHEDDTKNDVCSSCPWK